MKLIKNNPEEKLIEKVEVKKLITSIVKNVHTHNNGKNDRKTDYYLQNEK
jgi:hypothetical protein